MVASHERATQVVDRLGDRRSNGGLVRRNALALHRSESLQHDAGAVGTRSGVVVAVVETAVDSLLLDQLGGQHGGLLLIAVGIESKHRPGAVVGVVAGGQVAGGINLVDDCLDHGCAKRAVLGRNDLAHKGELASGAELEVALGVEQIAAALGGGSSHTGVLKVVGNCLGKPRSAVTQGFALQDTLESEAKVGNTGREAFDELPVHELALQKGKRFAVRIGGVGRSHTERQHSGCHDCCDHAQPRFCFEHSKPFSKRDLNVRPVKRQNPVAKCGNRVIGSLRLHP